MNIESKKNKDLILRFIELNDLIKGRDKLKENISELEYDLDSIINIVNTINDNINTCNAKISSWTELFADQPRKVIEAIKYFKEYDTLDKVIDDMNGINYENSVEYSNESTFAELGWGFENYRSVWNYFDLQDKFIEKEFKKKINEFNEEYGRLREKIRIGTSNIKTELKNNYIDDITISNDDRRLLLLSKIIYKKKNVNIFKDYDLLRRKILSYLQNYFCRSIKEEDLLEQEKYRLDEESKLLSLPGTIVTDEIKDIVLNNKNDLSYKLQNNRENQIRIAEEMINSITRDIEKSFSYLIPMKYIFDENFRRYAVECLFYERCNSVGEVLNYYENFKLHEATNINLEITLEKLDNLQSLQFHQIMELENISWGIDKVNSGIYDINEKLDNINENIMDMGFDIGNSIENIKEQNDINNKELMQEISYNNSSMIRQIESSNNLAYKQIDALSNINDESRRIAKNIYQVKEFTEKYRNAKMIEGKYYY